MSLSVAEAQKFNLNYTQITPVAQTYFRITSKCAFPLQPSLITAMS